MTDAEILKKAIEKAVKNGFEKWESGDAYFEYGEYYQIVFKHSFAKAFWGEESVIVPKNFMEASSLKAWQYHLQQMVLYENPIDYLRKFIEEK